MLTSVVVWETHPRFLQTTSSTLERSGQISFSLSVIEDILVNSITLHYITLSRRFYPKRLTKGGHNKLTDV